MTARQPELTFIGKVHTSYAELSACPRNVRYSAAAAVVEVFPEFEEGLTDIEASTHLILLYWLHEAERARLAYDPHKGERKRGVFAIRSPARPNPIGLGVVKLLGRRGRFLDIDRIDCLDGTPLIDIKPYVARNDAFPDASISWLNWD